MIATAPFANSTRALAMSDVRRENRDAGRPDLAHLRADQLEDQVEIVNHEIEDHRDVGAAGLERRQPLGLQEPRLVEVGGRGPHRPIESLHVTDLQAHAALPRRLHQLLGTGQRVGQRLLDERVDTPL